MRLLQELEDEAQDFTGPPLMAPSTLQKRYFRSVNIFHHNQECGESGGDPISYEL